jgi:hypothetical protein
MITRKEQIEGKLRVMDEERAEWAQEGKTVAMMAQGTYNQPPHIKIFSVFVILS